MFRLVDVRPAEALSPRAVIVIARLSRVCRSSRRPKLPALLAEPLATYFRASNAHDVEAMISQLTPGAIVEDEGGTYVGLDAVRGWMVETIRKYDFNIEITEVHEEPGRTIATGRISGTFPGSPVTVRHEFTLDGGKIARLVIR
jgi:hypothetical protein